MQYALREHVLPLLASTDTPQPRTRVDSGHVVDGDGIIRRIPKLAVRNRTSDEGNGVEATGAAGDWRVPCLDEGEYHMTIYVPRSLVGIESNRIEFRKFR